MIAGTGGTGTGRRPAAARQGLWYLTMALALLLGVGVAHYVAEQRAERSALFESERLNVSLGKTAIANALRDVASDLAYLAAHNQVRGLFQVEAAPARAALAEDFLAFVANKRVYDQARFLDLDGVERVRVNFNAGSPVIVPDDRLQNKSDRYYVEGTRQLESGQIYVSPFDLNVDQGRIELPIKPVIRIGIRVVDPAGIDSGTLLLNYLGDSLLGAFRAATAGVSDHVMLVNAEGFWLSSPRREDEWGIMRGRERTFASEHADEWQRMRGVQAGQLETPRGIFTFATIDPGAVLGDRAPAPSSPDTRPGPWKIIAQVPPEALQTAPGRFVARYLPLYLVMALLLAAAAALLVRVTHEQRLALAQVTEARQAEEALLKLSRAVEQGPSTVMITDTEGRIEYVNPKFTALTGYRLDEVRGMNPRILKSDATTPEQYADLWKTISSHGEWRGVFRNRKKSGEFYWEAATISAVRDRDGAIVNYLAVKEDITERRLLEERFRHCVESAPSAMVLTDHAGNMVLVNRQAERMFGYAREDLLGRPVEMLVPEANRAGHASHREAFLNEPRSRAMGMGVHLLGQHRDGHLFPIEAGLHTVESDEGRMALAAIVDITERRRLEQTLNDRNEEIAKTHALAAVGRMANMVAHDLRNPLSSIKMSLQIIAKQGTGRSSEQEAELREIALEQVQYMEEVLDDLLSYSRENNLAPEWVQVDKLLDAAILLVQKHIEDHDVKIRTRYQAGLPTLHGDAPRLRRAFCNLILNGIQASEGIEGRRPEIVVSTHLELAPDRPKIRVSICDNGRGLDADQVPRAFEPFFTTRAMGTGLGLAIVKRIVEQHAGTIELAPGDISGTCANLILPTGPLEPSSRHQAARGADGLTEVCDDELVDQEPAG